DATNVVVFMERGTKASTKFATKVQTSTFATGSSQGGRRPACRRGVSPPAFFAGESPAQTTGTAAPLPTRSVQGGEDSAEDRGANDDADADDASRHDAA